MSDERREACFDHLSPEDPARTTIFAVSLTQSPDTWLRRFRDGVDAVPSRLGLVVAGVSARSASATGGSTSWEFPPTESVSVASVEDPGDLTALGIKINTFLEQWERAGEPDDDRRLVLCFESVTVLLQYADLERVFRFLHVLIGRLRESGVEAHFHLDPTTQDEHTVATLSSLFDGSESHPPESRAQP